MHGRAAQSAKGRVEGLPGGAVTFLFADVEGSTRLVQRLGEDDYATMLPRSAAMRGASDVSAGRVAALRTIIRVAA